ncbi:helix-turn-helix transcriptional regulator [Lentzea sp.]|uniref:helix-turn-helix domain-containing protein n=1 Tax=Lentzea sp. TaxID=56099 RepID=UPI002ED04178
MEQLGEALRAWRDRLDPAAVGLAHGSPRRVPGLRRSELATLAGISVEYVVRLEQGRVATPSAQVCSALARALHLSDDEHAHLLRMAGHAADPSRVPRMITESLYRIVDQLAGNPLAIYDATWQLLHWNPLFAATFGDPTVHGAHDRNVLVWQFLGELPGVRQTAAERAAFEESLVADLRATTSRYPDDPDLAALVSRLGASPRFRELWERRAVGGHQSAHKLVRHPEVGDIALNSDILTTQDTNLRLVVYTPRQGTDARGKLDLLATIGVQRMSTL